jgi:hypothetical protein
MYGVALAGNLLVVLGLPAILAVHGSAARRLTLVGYVGIFVPLACSTSPRRPSRRS